MTDIQNHSTADLKIKTFDFLDANNNEKFTFKDLLIHVKGILKEIMNMMSTYLDSHLQVDEISLSLIDLLHKMEDLMMHFDFTIEVLESETEDDVDEIKKRFSAIEKQYEKIKSKDDLTTQQGKDTLLILYERMFIKLEKSAQKFFRKDRHGDLVFENSKENLAIIKITAKRAEHFLLHYPLVLSFPKDDVFCFPKTSEVWRELYLYTTFKQNLTKEEVHRSSKRLHVIIQASYIALRKHFQQKRKAEDYGLMYDLTKHILYYGTQEAKAEMDNLLLLLNPTLEDAFCVWNLPEHPIVSKLITLRNPIIGYDEMIYVPRLFPQITKELVLQEYQENTINKLTPIDPLLLKGPDLSMDKAKVKRELFIKEETKIPIRILFHNYLDFKGEHPDTLTGLARKVASSFKNAPITPEKDITGVIIIYIHGGGFVSQSSATYRLHLNRWANSLKLIHFAIDYRLAPKNQYPDGLDDVWQAYLWILNYADQILGIKKRKVILAGDSAGANFCLALTLRLIKAGYKTPDGCLLIYPCLSVDAMSSSPSYWKSVDDTILPASLVKLVAEAYVGKEFKNLEDPFISPLVASDELLQKLPPIRMVSGVNDPLHDDCWRFLSRLIKLKKDVRMIVHEHLSHGYLGHYELKNYEAYVEESCELIRELINCETKGNL